MLNADLDKLKQLAEEASANDEWREFSSYCALRALGMRPKALDHAHKFVVQASNWPECENREFVGWLLPKSFEYVIQQLAIPQPLLIALILPTLLKWTEDAPTDANPHLWLGMLREGDAMTHLEKALELDPKCELARKTLVTWVIGDIEYNQHHMPEFYINDPRIDLSELDRAMELARESNDDEWKKLNQQETAGLREVALAWIKDHPTEGDFASN